MSTVLACQPLYACDQHPGISHEAWMKWVNELNVAKEREKQGAKTADTKTDAAAAQVIKTRSRGEARTPNTAPATAEDGSLPSGRSRSGGFLRSMDELGK